MSSDARLDALNAWLERVLPVPIRSIAPATSDASFRRYFRITLAGELELPSSPAVRTLIAMDAPPAQEDSAAYVAVAALLAAAGVHAPTVHAQDLSAGFLLVSDLGTRTYREALDDATAPALYRDACGALIAWQLASRESVLPRYDEAMLARELALFPDWDVATHHGLARAPPPPPATLDSAFRQILDSALKQPQVYVHRDFHSRNLMVSQPNPGVLDFQGAVYGPISYDLVSLLRDAYIDWSEEQELDWAVRYWERAREARLPVAGDFGDFWRDFEWMGVQRHLKILGIFARLAHRDGKHGYLADLPRVMRYLRRACDRYRALGPLLQLLDELEARQPVVGYTF